MDLVPLKKSNLTRAQFGPAKTFNLDLENGRLSLLKRDVSKMVVYGTAVLVTLAQTLHRQTTPFP
jgi:hypothetical protein